jgi:hypothetical protein
MGGREEGRKWSALGGVVQRERPRAWEGLDERA